MFSIRLNSSVEACILAPARDPAAWNNHTCPTRPFDDLQQPLDSVLRSPRTYFTCNAECEDLPRLVQSLTAAIDAKDSHTSGHSERVSLITVHIARQLNLSAEAIRDLHLAGLLHDVGKVGIRDEVLFKPSRLTDEEQEHLRTHVLIGDQIISAIQPLARLRPGIRSHHERYDGTGYPDGLVGAEIPLAGRVLAVADSFDAMMSARRYREALPLARIEAVLLENAGTQWDPSVVEAFLACRLAVYASVYDDISRGGISR